MRTWTLEDLGDLMGLFPTERPPSGAHLRCVRAARSEAKYVRDVIPKAYGHVSLQAWPAESFLFTCAYQWPETVGVDEANALDAALLSGAMEAACRMEHPPWGAGLVCAAVGYQEGRTNANAVRIAASMATMQIVERGEWVVEGRPPKDIA